ncbi:unnamed protein product [marine sediment metagenome]|uniref:Uncharacterized protein n=1 Tax=marine sediment metagenome TaxID=412755 RepID=X1UJ00_9ZZZZ
MLKSKPLYLLIVCSNCIATRHFKPKDDGSDIYSCPVCGFEVEYNDGVVTKVAAFSKPEVERTVRNPYGRRGKPL